MIVGTAGHIDHGKTSLVKALTGVDADRLAEERERGISIDIGFAYLDRPDGTTMGFVDVPGHERFMRNMLAGATGIDFVMLVVAADDGVMPQTREHLAVVELLGLTQGVVALTKCDMVDEARQTEVIGQIKELLARGPLAGAEIIPVSSHTGAGVEDMRLYLDMVSSEFTRPEGAAPFRFAIDRSFSLQGIGTVVTGVVWQGGVKLGDTLTLSPQGVEARVRALHVQDKPAEHAREGERCGINLAIKLDASAVHRGDFLIDPALHEPTARIDAQVRLLPAEDRPLGHWTAVRVHHAAAEIPARLALLQDAPIDAGGNGRVQLVLDRPIAAAVGDPFVFRNAEGTRTMGGGRFLDLRPPARRRKLPRRLEQLDAMQIADPAASLAAQIAIWPWCVERDAFLRDHAIGAQAAETLLAATAHQSAVMGKSTYLFAQEVWDKLQSSALGEVGLFHKRYPQLLGPNLQRLMGSLGPRLAQRPAQAFLGGLVVRKLLARESGVYRLPNHRLGLDRADDELWQMIRPLLSGEARFRPPRAGPIAEELRRRDFDVRRVLKAMSKQGQLVEIAPDHFFLRDAMGEVAAIVGKIAAAAEDGYFGAALLRDELDNGRKVAIQMLEYFDRQGLTLRRGDLRIIDPRRVERYSANTLEGAA